MMEILRRIKVHSDVEYLQGPSPSQLKMLIMIMMMMFRSKTHQLTLSISPGSSHKSLKSSNQSLSSWRKQVTFSIKHYFFFILLKVSFDDSLSETAGDLKQTKVMQNKSGKVREKSLL